MTSRNGGAERKDGAALSESGSGPARTEKPAHEISNLALATLTGRSALSTSLVQAPQAGLPAVPQALDEDEAPEAASAEPERRKLSQILHAIAHDESRARVSVADMVEAMDARAFGALLLIFAVPNVLPTPPGTSGILGIPLIFLAAQMMLGRSPWLPQIIALRSMARHDFAQLVMRITPLLGRAERLLAPRLGFLTHPLSERVLGAVCLVLAIVLALPIPLGNILPAFAICLIALGVLERDGIWVIAGVTMAAISLMVVAGVIYAMARAILYVLMGAFGG